MERSKVTSSLSTLIMLSVWVPMRRPRTGGGQSSSFPACLTQTRCSTENTSSASDSGARKKAVFAREAGIVFRAPKRTLGDLDAEIAAKLITAAADIALVVDAKGVIRYRNVRGEKMDEAVDALLAEMDGSSTN